MDQFPPMFSPPRVMEAPNPTKVDTTTQHPTKEDPTTNSRCPNAKPKCNTNTINHTLGISDDYYGNRADRDRSSEW
jgi:hypothetical protein